MDIEFPVMGQALPIELSNTLWVHAGRVIDALSTVGGTSRWVATIAPRLPESPPDVDEDLRAGLIALRQSVRAVLAATVTAQPLPPEALSRLSAASRAAPAWWEIAWESDRPVARRHRRGSPSRGILATLADDTISLVAGRATFPLRSCPGPGCIGFFLQDKARRRFCSPTCATRGRVAQHYQRHAHPPKIRGGDAPPAGPRPL